MPIVVSYLRELVLQALDRPVFIRNARPLTEEETIPHRYLTDDLSVILTFASEPCSTPPPYDLPTDCYYEKNDRRWFWHASAALWNPERQRTRWPAGIGDRAKIADAASRCTELTQVKNSRWEGMWYAEAFHVFWRPSDEEIACAAHSAAVGRELVI